MRTGATAYDVIVLDVMLPGRDGFEICRELREQRNWAGVLMLTARNAVEDRVTGLNAGADDYLAKPFSFAELVARVRALARRGAVERPVVLEVGDLRLDRSRLQVWRGDVAVDLSHKEFALLEALMLRPGPFRDAGYVGVLQVLALFAGISRSGVTMVGGLWRGLGHEDAARFAFLLATPPILAAGILKVPSLFGHAGDHIHGQLAVGFVITGVTALLSVRFLLRYFRTRTLTPFAGYCLIAGLASIIRFSVG